MRFVCPKCRGRLNVFDGYVKCPEGHSYDRARAGYYNLLLSNSGQNHGDNREMILARRDFLDTGAYAPLRERIAELVDECLFSNGTILDVGCGEGYYTDAIARKLLESGKSAEIYGFDISRDAVTSASKRNKAFNLAVASAYKIPVADGDFDVLINMFSPFSLEETLRALRRGGKFIMAIPAEEHLFGLKERAYDTPYKNEVKDSALLGFTLLSREKISYRLTLTKNSDIRALFMMTPYAYRTPKDRREAVLSLNHLETTVEFIIFVYEKD